MLLPARRVWSAGKVFLLSVRAGATGKFGFFLAGRISETLLGNAQNCEHVSPKSELKESN